jgi:alkylhydroperoxidase family enzyme
VDGEDASSETPDVGVFRLEKPRIQPVERGDWTPAQRAYLTPHEQAGRLFNVFKTAAHHPDAAGSFDAFAFGHINSDANTLSPRHRELLILRIGWLCRSEYEWAAHSDVARSIGFSEEDLVRITEGPDASEWTPFEASLLRAADELHSDAFITEATWQALSAQYNTQQLMDVVFTVGAYNLVSMLLNSWGVQLDEGFTGFPEGT